MLLKSVKIKNYRGYSHQIELSIAQITAIIGRNDIGKSTILDALDTFFNQSKMDVSDRNIHCGDENVIISCEFSNFPTEIIIDDTVQTSLQSEFMLNSNGLLEVQKEYNASGKETIYIIANHPANEPYDNLLSKKRGDLQRLLRDAELQEGVNQNINSEMRKALWASLGDELSLSERRISADKEDAKNIWTKIIPFLPKYNVFRADRPSTDEDALAQDPMQIAMKAAIFEKQDELSRIAEDIRKKVSAVADRTIGKLREFDVGLASSLTPDFKKPPAWDKAFSFSLTGDEDIPINKRGSGIRRLVLFSFFRASCEENVEGDTDVIYAVEEPETSQHPDFQKTIISTFLQMIENPHCQILLTTHVPGLAKLLPVNALRYITNGEGYPEIESIDDGSLRRLADELGVLPDLTPPLAPYNAIRLLVCVEGPNDVNFLNTLTKRLHEDQSSIPSLQSARDVVIFPLGGGTLQEWANHNYLTKLGVPEYHIYDRDDEAKYQQACDIVNARTDGSSARITKRREMENYIHSKTIFECFNIQLDIDHNTNVPAKLSAELRARRERGCSERAVKKKLNTECVEKMTLELLNECDPDHEVLSWICDIFDLRIDSYIS